MHEGCGPKPGEVWREDEEMSRRRNRIHARVPPANENVTMTAGNRVLTESVFRDTGLYEFLEGLKRCQGNTGGAENLAHVANALEIDGD